jgi:hypothetical protein
MSRANEPAYPVPATEHTPPVYGLTIREYFAAMAMQGLLAGADVRERWDPHPLANQSVLCADALIAELAKP